MPPPLLLKVVGVARRPGDEPWQMVALIGFADALRPAPHLDDLGAALAHLAQLHLAGDAFGQRLAHYERFYIGEPMFVASFYSRSADISEGQVLLDELLAEGKEALEERKASSVSA